MSANALERALQDSERSLIACKAAIANPASALVPSTFATTYHAGETGVHFEQYLHYRDWPFVCINAIAKRIAGQPIYVAKLKGQPRRGVSKSFLDDLIPLDQHPFLDAVHAPNGLMTKWPLIFSTVASLNLTGKSHWWFPPLSRGDTQREIWPLPSSWIRPETDLRDTYIIRPYNAAEEITVPSADVAYFGLPDPSNPFTAVSPLQAQANAVDADNAIQAAQARSYHNGLMPQLAIIAGDIGNNVTGAEDGTRPLLNQDQRNMIMDALRKMYQGPAKSGQAIILDRMIKDVKRISNAPNEMDFMESGTQIRSRIFSAYGVNPIIVGEIAGANRAQAVVAEESFVTNVVNPLIELISEVLTRWVVPIYSRDGARYVAYIEPCRVKDHELNIKEMDVSAKYGFLSRDEVRARFYGLPPMPGGDVVPCPMNVEMVPVGQIPGIDDEDEPTDDDAEDPLEPDVRSVAGWRLREDGTTQYTYGPPVKKNG